MWCSVLKGCNGRRGDLRREERRGEVEGKEEGRVECEELGGRKYT